jgi:C-terminal processing protease CtpA/Prc
VQSILPLRSASTGLRLTTAHFYGPLGETLEGRGVSPNVSSPRPIDALGKPQPIPSTPDAIADSQLREALEILNRPETARRAG